MTTPPPSTLSLSFSGHEVDRLGSQIPTGPQNSAPTPISEPHGVPLLYTTLTQPRCLNGGVQNLHSSTLEFGLRHSCRLERLRERLSLSSLSPPTILTPAHPGVWGFSKLSRNLSWSLVPRVVTEETHAGSLLRNRQETPAGVTLPAALRSRHSSFPRG